MPSIKKNVFVFETEQQALDAVNVINASQGLPTDECVSYVVPVVINGLITLYANHLTKAILGDGWVTIDIEIEFLTIK